MAKPSAMEIANAVAQKADATEKKRKAPKKAPPTKPAPDQDSGAIQMPPMKGMK